MSLRPLVAMPLAKWTIVGVRRRSMYYCYRDLHASPGRLQARRPTGAIASIDLAVPTEGEGR
jgi:hypothetical protein